MNFEIDGETTVNVIWQPYQGKTFTRLERHFNVTQSFVPLDGSLSVVAVAAPTDPDKPNDTPRPEDVHAFLIDGTKGFGYKTGDLALAEPLHPLSPRCEFHHSQR